MRGVKVTVSPDCAYPKPFGLVYEAKGFYIQKRHIVVVGNLKDDSTIRLKYPLKDVQIEIIF